MEMLDVVDDLVQSVVSITVRVLNGYFLEEKSLGLRRYVLLLTRYDVRTQHPYVVLTPLP